MKTNKELFRAKRVLQEHCEKQHKYRDYDNELSCVCPFFHKGTEKEEAYCDLTSSSVAIPKYWD